MMNTINIGAASNSVVVSGNLTDSKINIQSNSNEDLTLKLEQLSQYVEQLVKLFPAQKAEQILNDLTILKQEATSSKPREKHFQLSAEGILEAAKICADLVNPIGTTLKGIYEILPF